MDFLNEFVSFSILATDDNDLFRTTLGSNSYGINSSLLNGHDLQMPSFNQATPINGYNMNMKPEPEGNF